VNYNWNWHIFFEPNPTGAGNYLDLLLSGLVLTIETALLAWVIALIFGTIIGILRSLPSKTASWIGFAYVEFFRNMPLLVQLFLWFFVLPELLPRSAGLWLKQMPNAPFWTAAIGIGLFMSARVAVQLQAGIASLPRGQRQAATALGLTTVQVYRYVLLPMAFRIVIPPLTSESMNIVKNSSVAFAVSIAELTMFAMQAQEETSRGIEVYLAVTGLYFISAFAINRLAIFIEHRVQVPGMIGGGK
jgi:glutamate/aspartate transport system permease protein